MRLGLSGREKCYPETLRVPSDKTIELVIEPNPSPAASSQTSHKRTLSPSSLSFLSAKRTKPIHAFPPTHNHAPGGPLTPITPIPPSSSFSIHTGSERRVSSHPHPTPSTYPPSPVQPQSPHPQPVTHPWKKSDSNAIICAWLRAQIQQSYPVDYALCAKAKGRVLPVPEMLKVYHFVQDMINEYNDRRTPDNLEGAADLKMSKVRLGMPCIRGRF